MKEKLESIRVEYNSKEINYKSLLSNPIDQFKLWMNDAINSKIKDANAVILSTYDNEIGVQSRVVLIKQINEIGLVFYTNFDSVKARQIAKNKNVSLCFFWSNLERQVRINGIVKKISDPLFGNKDFLDETLLPLEFLLYSTRNFEPSKILSK